MSDGTPWHQNDALFRSLLKTGRGYEGYVAGRLVSTGLGVRILPASVRPDVSVRSEYRDQRDIIVETPKGQLVDIEVKSRSIRFDGASDFPYPDILVDVKSVVDEKGPPFAFVCVSQSTLGMIVVPQSSRSMWREKTSTDRVRGIDQTWYTCPLSVTRSFDDLCGYLQEL